jgi:hypothetical protein
MTRRGEFEAVCDEADQIYRRLVGKSPTRFMVMRRELGTPRACMILIPRPDIQTGFLNLAEVGRLDQTIESIVQDSYWDPVFADEGYHLHRIEAMKAAARFRLEHWRDLMSLPRP